MDYLDYFREISSIPRGSYHNEKISGYLVNFAKEHGLSYYQDEALNVLIRKEATKGYEDLPGIILQGHMDMVCVKEKESRHDFLTQGLELLEDEDFIWARDTSLGGDDGIAIAYGLAILESEQYEHPMLELLVTTDEEVGMDGAMAFDASQLKGKWLLNIDSEEEDTILTGCAGGMTGRVEIGINRAEPEKETFNTKRNFYEIEVRGLAGGHSGTEIDKNRKNASIVLARVLSELKESLNFLLFDLWGGDKDNVITPKAGAVISFTENEKDALEYADNIFNKIMEELIPCEPGIKIEIKKCQTPDFKKPLDENSLSRILNYILLAPNGIQAMSPSIKGMVESSLNLGILNMEETKLVLGHSVRSMSPAYKGYMALKLKTLAELLGGTYREHGSYPEWRYKENSEFRDRAVSVYEKMFHRKPKLLLIHAGLECGILSQKCPGLEIISTGPDIFDAHSTREKLSKASAKRVFDYVLEVLKCGRNA